MVLDTVYFVQVVPSYFEIPNCVPIHKFSEESSKIAVTLLLINPFEVFCLVKVVAL